MAKSEVAVVHVMVPVAAAIVQLPFEASAVVPDAGVSVAVAAEP
jgi:hypothetical protein